MKEKTAKTEIDLELMMETSDLSKAEYNFVCVTRICKDVIKSPLIDVLTHYSSPTELYMKIQSCSMLNTGKDKLSPDQLRLCSPEHLLFPDYKTFDFSLLYKLLKHLCPSLRPTQGWGFEPRCTDTLIGDEIERLRQFSVYMRLCSTRMSDGKFEEFINSVQHVFNRFQSFTKNWSNYNYEEELNKIVLMELGYKLPKKEEQLKNVQLALMPSKYSDKKEEPAILIIGAEEAICGSTIRFKVNVKPANPSEWSVNWQKNRTGATELIEIRHKKYSGSHSRQLVINCVEKEDEGKYQAFLSRESNGKIYKIFSNCIFFLPQKDLPCFDVWNNETEERGITIYYKVVECSPNLNKIKWMKNGETLVLRNKKYVGGGLKDGFITITSPTIADRGTYSCTVTNAVGSVSKRVTLGVPKIDIERRENLDGSQCLIAKITSIPEAYHAQWKVKRNDHEKYSLIDINNPIYKGTSNSLPCPVLVVKKKELMENKCFHIKVDNPIGSTIQEIFYMPIRYFFYYPAKDFDHFYYIYNLIRNCESRMKMTLFSEGQKNAFTSKDVVIKIGIAGQFEKQDLNLISGGTWKETVSEDEQSWNVSPLLCFQNNLSLELVVEIVRKICAPHRIIVKSDTTCKEEIKKADSIIFVGKNRQKIKKTITICLEEPFHQILSKWSEDIRNLGSSQFASDIVAEITNIGKYLVFEKTKNTATESGLQGGFTEFIVPDNVKHYLFRMPFINSFGIWEKLSFKVFVQKGTDVYEIKKKLLKINKNFFDNFHIDVVIGKYVLKNTMKQGDPLRSREPNNFNEGTLGGFVRRNDNEKKIYALTCNHIFPEEKKPAFANASNGRTEIGTCVFTTKNEACDFAAIEIMNSCLDVCDVTFRREDKKKVNAKIYTENLNNIGLVHKIGAATNVTNGRIVSLEYYDKEMNNHSRDNIFLVKGINGPFSDEGDSGSLVFSRPNCVIQNYVNVLGMVFAKNIKLDYDGDADDDPNRTSTAFNAEDNLSVCYRIHPALELFKESQGEGFEVKFQDDLSVTLSSLSSRSSSRSSSSGNLSDISKRLLLK